MMLDLNDKIPGAPNFVWKEVFASQTAEAKGVVNYPSREDELRVIGNIEYLMSYVQLVRYALDTPIAITSGYRSEQLNRLVGGSARSFHSHGCAVDMVLLPRSRDNLVKLFRALYDGGIYTELIAEEISANGGGWIHFALQRGRQDERQLKYKAVGEPVVRMKFNDIIGKI